MIIFKDNTPFTRYEYTKESDFEDDIIKNSQLFFGSQSVYFNNKRKIKSTALGNSIPDGFLFDLKDLDNPEFYIIEVELKEHSFYSHIFPQITKFIAFYQNAETRKELIDKLYTIIKEDSVLEKRLMKLIKNMELYKFLSDLIDSSQNILLILDGEKKELPEIMDIYADTWGKKVKLQIVQKYINNSETLYTMTPEFDAIEYYMVGNSDEVDDTKLEISEEFHLENVNQNVKEAYFTLKKKMLEVNNNLRFNTQKYYISVVNKRNVVFYKFRKKKIWLVVMMPEKDIRELIKKHQVKALSQSVKNFYNGDCAFIELLNSDNLDEIIQTIRPLLVATIDEEQK